MGQKVHGKRPLKRGVGGGARSSDPKEAERQEDVTWKNLLKSLRTSPQMASPDERREKRNRFF